MKFTEEKYLSERVEDQINWYDKKSAVNKKGHFISKLIEVLGSSLITLIAGFSDKIDSSEWIIGIMAFSVAISSAVSSLYKFQENWIKYRSVAEQLKHEKYMYLTGSSEYSEEDKYKLFVENIELLISKENTDWSLMHKHEKKNSKINTNEIQT